jgi:hypothetical protein
MPTRTQWAGLLRGASDAEIRRPLWEFPPEARPAVQHERRARFQMDDEPIGDPEYS